jgi:hypothetical protein
MFYLECLLENDSFSFSNPDLTLCEVMTIAQNREQRHIRWGLDCEDDCYYGYIGYEQAYKITN